MKQRFSLAVVLVFVSACACLAQTEATPATSTAPKPRPRISKAQLQRQLAAIERRFWEGWAKADIKPFKANIAADAVMVGESGTQDKETIVKAIEAAGCVVRSYDLSDFKLISLGGNTAILAYKGNQDATCAGEVLPKSVWVTTVYVRRGGRWLAVAHQETAAKQ